MPRQALLSVTILEDPDLDVVTPTYGNSPLIPIVSRPAEESETFLDRLWAHPFYKRLIGPLNEPVEDSSTAIANSITPGVLLCLWVGHCNRTASIIKMSRASGWAP